MGAPVVVMSEAFIVESVVVVAPRLVAVTAVPARMAHVVAFWYVRLGDLQVYHHL